MIGDPGARSIGLWNGSWHPRDLIKINHDVNHDVSSMQAGESTDDELLRSGRRQEELLLWYSVISVAELSNKTDPGGLDAETGETAMRNGHVGCYQSDPRKNSTVIRNALMLLPPANKLPFYAGRDGASSRQMAPNPTRNIIRSTSYSTRVSK